MTSIPYEAFLLVIPVIAALWAIFRKLAVRHFIEAQILLVITVFLIGDGIAAIAQLHEDTMRVPEWMNLMQLYLGVILLPLAYMYFAIQVGVGWKNKAIYECLFLSLLVLIPNITVFIGNASLGSDVAIVAHKVHVIRNGSLIYIEDINDIVVILQALIIVYRIFVFNRTLSKFELAFSKELKTFFLLALLLIGYAIATFIVPWDYWMSHKFLFTAGFALFTSTEYIQIAKNRDISALVTKDMDEPVQLHEFIAQNNDLARRARYLLEDQKRYLLPGLVIDDMVNELGTNRTYFTRMMRIEFGQSFTEYVNNMRLKYSQDLLRNTDKSISDIAEESGFGSASAYCRVFKRITETTPEAWRLANHKA